MRKGEEEASFPPGFMEPGFTNAFFVVWSGQLCLKQKEEREEDDGERGTKWKSKLSGGCSRNS